MATFILGNVNVTKYINNSPIRAGNGNDVITIIGNQDITFTGNRNNTICVQRNDKVFIQGNENVVYN